MQRKLIRIAALALLCAAGFFSQAPARADALSDCAAQIPWGAPTVTDGAKIDYVCHKGYLSALDVAAKVPRWVAYDLTGKHTLGCLGRKGLQFKVDALAPAEDQGRLKDYSKSSYDLGHMAPNQDFAWNAGQQRDTFSFANVAPQLPDLNRQGWERGEEYVRAWALDRKEVEVYVGAVVSSGDEPLGDDKVDIPSAFYKVIVDPQTKEVFAFVMKQEPVAKQPLDQFVTKVADIEKMANVTLPLPNDYTEASTPWDDTLAGWRKAKRAACPVKKKAEKH
jgi:endonuclease G, mitochondrial